MLELLGWKNIFQPGCKIIKQDIYEIILTRSRVETHTSHASSCCSEVCVPSLVGWPSSVSERVRSSDIRRELGAEASQVVWASTVSLMPPGRLQEVIRARPSGRRPRGRPKTRWRDAEGGSELIAYSCSSFRSLTLKIKVHEVRVINHVLSPFSVPS